MTDTPTHQPCPSEKTEWVKPQLIQIGDGVSEVKNGTTPTSDATLETGDS